MECDICLEKFDHSFNKPMVLFKCAHTICHKCVDALEVKKCPSCNSLIEDSQTNWSLLKHVPESEYDKKRAELVTTLAKFENKKMQLSESAQKKRDVDANLMKKLKNKVELQSNELIKQIYANKKQLFKEIESYCKNLNRNESLTESIPVYEKDEEREKTIKDALNKNTLGKDWLDITNASLLEQIIELENKLAIINGSTPSIEFCLNKNTKIEHNFIGEIKHMNSTITSLEEMTIQDNNSNNAAKSNKSNKNRNKNGRNRNEMEKSVILSSPEQASELMTLCEFQADQKWTLLYRATIDGFSADSFHLKCDNKPNTFVLIKSQMGNVFGGYTEQNWCVMQPEMTNRNDYRFKFDNKAFIFSLINSENRPLLMKAESKPHPYFANEETSVSASIRCESNLGPSFGGDSMLLGDIHITNNSNIPNDFRHRWSKSNLGVNFKHPLYNFRGHRARSYLL